MFTYETRVEIWNITVHLLEHNPHTSEVMTYSSFETQYRATPVPSIHGPVTPVLRKPVIPPAPLVVGLTAGGWGSTATNDRIITR